MSLCTSNVDVDIPNSQLSDKDVRKERLRDTLLSYSSHSQDACEGGFKDFNTDNYTLGIKPA